MVPPGCDSEATRFAGGRAPSYAGPMSESARLSPAARPARGSAWLVVVVMTVITLTVIIGQSFSTDNTPASITGRTATSSELVDGP